MSDEPAGGDATGRPAPAGNGGRQVDLAGELELSAARAAVWDALNDPALLARCIGGCTGFESLPAAADERRYRISLSARFGPLKPECRVDVRLHDVEPGTGYTIVGQGDAGRLARGQATGRITLADDAGGCTVRYRAEVCIDGRLARLGPRVLTPAGRRLLARFFKTVDTEIAAAAQA